MGSLSRYGRCERFIKHFNDKLVEEVSPFQDGKLYEVVSQHLAMDPVEEVVKLCVCLKDGGKHGQQEELWMTETLFDPELGEADTVEYLTPYLDAKDTKVLLKAADL